MSTSGCTGGLSWHDYLVMREKALFSGDGKARCRIVVGLQEKKVCLDCKSVVAYALKVVIIGKFRGLRLKFRFLLGFV